MLEIGTGSTVSKAAVVWSWLCGCVVMGMAYAIHKVERMTVKVESIACGNLILLPMARWA